MLGSIWLVFCITLFFFSWTNEICGTDLYLAKFTFFGQKNAIFFPHFQEKGFNLDAGIQSSGKLSVIIRKNLANFK
ncbi:hypothetical protein QQP08_013807, partial [Theobroma cacao]